MKEHIDALFEYIENHFAELQHATPIYELYGALYEIGSNWEYYKELFEQA